MRKPILENRKQSCRYSMVCCIKNPASVQCTEYTVYEYTYHSHRLSVCGVSRI